MPTHATLLSFFQLFPHSNLSYMVCKTQPGCWECGPLFHRPSIEDADGLLELCFLRTCPKSWTLLETKGSWDKKGQPESACL